MKQKKSKFCNLLSKAMLIWYMYQQFYLFVHLIHCCIRYWNSAATVLQYLLHTSTQLLNYSVDELLIFPHPNLTQLTTFLTQR